MQISQYRFHQIIEKWTFLNSTRKGQLKNVQDGISRPLGSQEIQKTKVEHVLLDTLYDVITIPLVGLRGVIGAMDNVQSFVGFFYGFLEPCGRKLKEQRYTQPLYSVQWC